MLHLITVLIVLLKVTQRDYLNSTKARYLQVVTGINRRLKVRNAFCDQTKLDR